MKKIITISIISSVISIISAISIISTADAATINSSRSQSYFQNTGINSGLVGWWTFDGKDVDATQVFDKSNTGNTGTRVGGITMAAGRLGQGMRGNVDTTKYINIPDPVNGSLDFPNNAPFTVSAWFYHNTADVSGASYGDTIVTKGVVGDCTAPYALVMESGTPTRISLVISDGTTCPNRTYATGSTTILAKKWYHTVGVYDGTNIKLYINGKKEADVVATIIPIADGNPLRIGWGHPSFGWDGLIDDVRIYNRAISASEVKQLYAQGSSATINKTVGAQSYQTDGLKKNLSGWWTLDGKDMSGTALYDKSGHNYTAVRVAATPIAGKIGQALNFSVELQSYISIPYNSDTDLTGTYSTVSEWVYVDHFDVGGNSLADLYCAVGSNFSCIYSINAMGSIYFDFGAGDPYTYNVAVNASLKKWHHFVFIIDRNVNKGTVYMDGVYKGQTAAWPAYTPAVTLITIGKNTRTGNGFDFLNGKIDDVRVWTRALSAAEIKQLYAQGSSATVNKTIGTASYEQGQGINSGLIGWWTFDGKDTNATQVLDKSGQSNTGTRTSVTPVAGKIGQGMSFNGTSGYISSSATGFTATGISFSAWVKKRSNPASWSQIVGDSANGGALYIKPSTGDLRFQLSLVSAGVVVVDNAISLNGWDHLVGTWQSGDKLKVYRNGVLVNSSAAAYTDTINSFSGFWIGRYLSGGYFDALIDDVRVYNRALSAAEIQQLYQLGK